MGMEMEMVNGTIAKRYAGFTAALDGSSLNQTIQMPAGANFSCRTCDKSYVQVDPVPPMVHMVQLDRFSPVTATRWCCSASPLRCWWN